MNVSLNVVPWILMLVPILELALPAQVTWFVDAAATPGGNGTAAMPWTSIQSAIAASANSDTVVVAPGRYLETINFLGRAITVRASAGPLRTTIDAQSAGTVVTFSTNEGPNSVLNGFTITGGQGGTSLEVGVAGGIYCRLTSPGIYNCIIKGNRGGNGGPGGQNYYYCCTIGGCGYYCFTWGPGRPGGPGGVLCRDSSATFVNCILAGNFGGHAGYSPAGSGPGGPGGFLAFRTTSGFPEPHPYVVFCTVVNNVSGSGSYQVGGIMESNPGFGPQVILVTNTIVWNNFGGQISGNIAAAYCDIMGGAPGTGNIAANPMFVDPSADDWHVGATSPCRDSGTPSPAVPPPYPFTHDFEGHPRDINAGPDIGADEISLIVDIYQPQVLGGPILVVDHDVIPGREYYNVFTVNEPCPEGPGSGPFGGLCTADPSFLLLQLSLPLGAAPVHVSPAVNPQTFGPYVLPPGTVLEVVLFDFTGGAFGLVSPVRRYVVH